MKSTKIKKGLILVSIASGVLAVGCELLVDFDRTRLTEDAGTSIADANLLETSAPTQDAGDAGDAQTPGDDGGDGGEDAEAG